MKRLVNMAFVFSLFIFFCSCFGNLVLADICFINDYHMDIKINEDGSCNFTERIEDYFGGDFEGCIYFEMYYHDCGNFEDYSVSVIEDGQEKVLDLNDSGNPGTYRLHFEDDSGVAYFELHVPSGSGTKIFLLKYKLSAAVKKFEDTAQFKFTPKNFWLEIKNFNGQIFFQHEAKTEDFENICTLAILRKQNK